MKKLLFTSLICCLLFSCAKTITPQKPGNEHIHELDNSEIFVGKHKAQAAVLGIFHFSNPGLDSFKPKFSVDILSGKRQAELQELIKSLSEYKPTRILIEVPRKEGDSIINSRYQNYLNGEFDISDKTNEVYQLAFRLAEKLGHDRIYASDAKNAKWFGAEIDWDNYDAAEYQKSLGQYEKAHRYSYNDIYELHDSLKTVTTLKENLKYLNDPRVRLKSHQAYLTGTILTGAGDLYVGADAVARWYQRNLKIFANTYDIANFSKEERILLIYGAGHVWQLRQLFKDSPDFEYVEVNEYF